MAHILMVKPIRALELHYPMIRFVIRWCSFIISAMFFGYSNLLLVHLRLKHQRGWYNRLLSKGHVCYQVKIKVSVFSSKPSKTQEKRQSRYTDGI